MNIFVFSSNPEIRQRIADEFSGSKNNIQSFSLFADLKSAIEKEAIVFLLYHLGLRQNDEADFMSIQTNFKQKLNTLVLTNTPNPEQGVRLLNINVRGYANTYLEHDKLMMALSVIEQGEIWAGASLIQYMLTNSTAKDNFEESPGISSNVENSVFHQLTAREQEIAQKILTGLQNKLIADELSITERTVKAHLSAIYKKLEVRNRLELTIKLQQANRRTLS